MSDPDAFSVLAESTRQKLRQLDQPDWLEPMMATLTDKRFSDPDWIFERKLDGERCIAYRNGDNIWLMSRNKNRLNVHYPELTKALGTVNQKKFIVDGEIVAFEGKITSFSRLQQRMHIQDVDEARRSDVAVYFYLFDVLFLDGFDTTKLSLRDRKLVLKHAFEFADPLRYTTNINERGTAYFDEACERGWEGIIAKDAGAAYVHGRSRKWLKFKCVNQQEFVVGGYTEPHGERIGFGALLLGYYEKDILRYAGKVGTGFDEETLGRLYERLRSQMRDEPPFAEADLSEKEVHWVKPDLVVEIGFEEWTDNNKLRQPRFLGLREDKEAQDVNREEPSSTK